MVSKKRGLNKGLDALLAETIGSSNFPVPTTRIPNEITNLADDKSGGNEVAILAEPESGGEEFHTPNNLSFLPVDKLQPGKYQPRKGIEGSELEPLVESIKVQGVLQPIVVRPIDDAGGFEIIAGERRWRAAMLANLSEIPAIVKDVADDAALAIGLIENIQRENLTVLEEAEALGKLAKEFALTHAEVARAVGKSRASVTNFLRLLTLRAEVKALLERGSLDMGHAKVILALPGHQQTEIAKIVAAKQLSVRETEALVARNLHSPKKKQFENTPDPNIRRFQVDLSEKIGSPVKVLHSRSGKGKIVISYNNLEELEGILDHIQ